MGHSWSAVKNYQSTSSGLVVSKGDIPHLAVFPAEGTWKSTKPAVPFELVILLLSNMIDDLFESLLLLKNCFPVKMPLVRLNEVGV